MFPLSARHLLNSESQNEICKRLVVYKEVAPLNNLAENQKPLNFLKGLSLLW